MFNKTSLKFKKFRASKASAQKIVTTSAENSHFL